MSSVPEKAAQFRAHPAALEAAADLRRESDPQVAQGVRPQSEARLPVPSRPPRVPAHNARVAAFLAARQAQLAAQGQRIVVAEPHRFAYRSLLGARRVSFGYALNLEFVYRSPSGSVYNVTGYVLGHGDGLLTGESYPRACTCPDFQKRRGPARDQLRGESRCCKHLRLFSAVAYLWQGHLPWVGGIPKEQQAAGAGWELREF